MTSFFWDLEYWPILDTPHSLDQMHITKNILESLLGTLMNMPERTKDGPKVRKDFEFLKIGKDLQMPGKRSKETETETETEDRGKKVNKKEEQYCPPLAPP